jgi:hypothetical protein
MINQIELEGKPPQNNRISTKIKSCQSQDGIKITA